MMFEPDGTMIMMDETPCTEEQLTKARETVEWFFDRDPAAKLEMLQALGLETYERVIVVNQHGRTRRVMS
jgi:hypothetical protein